MNPHPALACLGQGTMEGMDMSLTPTLRQYLADHHIAYEILGHQRTSSSLATANAAHVPAGMLAKSVVLEDDFGFLVAVIPANCHLALGQVRRLLDRRLGLASERSIAALFRDCEAGAVPAAGCAYGLDTVVDDSLVDQPEVYIEGGDHRELLHLSKDQFRRLFSAARCGRISHTFV
ncbi:MAG: YbaK/EbsC family protein [Gammaproteobacteria bacterium]|nr:YbaK/EbsC family protein [Gammaproteobacteria bacterium]